MTVTIQFLEYLLLLKRNTWEIRKVKAAAVIKAKIAWKITTKVLNEALFTVNLTVTSCTCDFCSYSNVNPSYSITNLKPYIKVF